MREWRNAGARYVVEYDGKPVANCRKAFERLVALAKLDKHVVRHTLRPTAATWMMQDGIDFAEAAGYLGMTVETLQRPTATTTQTIRGVRRPPCRAAPTAPAPALPPTFRQ